MIPGYYPSRQWTPPRGNSLSLLKKLFAIGILLAILTFIVVNRQGLIKLQQLQRDQQALAGKLASLHVETGRLEATKAQLEVDLEYIEQLAREKYRMVRKGEKLFRVVPRRSQSDTLLPAND